MIAEQIQNPPSTLRLAIGQNRDGISKRHITKVGFFTDRSRTVESIKIRGDIDQLGTMLHEVGIDDLFTVLRAGEFRITQRTILSISQEIADGNRILSPRLK